MTNHIQCKLFKAKYSAALIGKHYDNKYGTFVSTSLLTRQASQFRSQLVSVPFISPAP